MTPAMSWSDLLFTFHGRINRAKFWLAWLVTALMAAIGFLPAIALSLAGAKNETLYNAAMLPVLLAGVLVTYVQFTSNIKRLHDRNKSGWWLLFFVGVSGVLNIAVDQIDKIVEAGEGARVPLKVAGLAALLASLAVGVWWIVELGCRRGTVGPNQYGLDPLGAAQAADVHPVTI